MASLPYPALCFASSSARQLFASGAAIHIQDSSRLTSSSTASSSSGTNHQTGLIRHIAISGDETYAATLGDDKTLHVYSLTSSPPDLLSTRATIKRGSHVSFARNNDIIVSDKVGDVYSYPLHPPSQNTKGVRPSATELVSDPSKNPDATLLLGHVSVITAHVITPDGNHIITADRDEHIRVSRYPKSYIIERYLLGSDGFVSALHIPSSRSTLLLSAGGEPVIRIWDWTTGVQLGTIEIWSEVLPHRRVRSMMRKLKNPRKGVKLDPSESGDTGAFYIPPEGWLLPSGQGVCVKKIETVNFEDQEIILFFSEGSAPHEYLSIRPG